MAIPNWLANLEIIKQMNGSAQVHLRASRKQSFLPGFLSFGDFLIRSATSYELLEGKIGYYQFSMVHQEQNLILKGIFRNLGIHKH